MMTYKQFMLLTFDRVIANKERLGVAAFRTLALHYPQLVYKIAGTEFDPRYSLKIRGMCKYLGFEMSPLQVIDIREFVINLNPPSYPLAPTPNYSLDLYIPEL